MTVAEYCKARAQWWRDEIRRVPPTSPHVVADAQKLFADAIADWGDRAVNSSNFEHIAAMWDRAAELAP